MTETTGATGTQADPGTQPPAGIAEAQAAYAAGETQPPESISLEEAKKLRSEANSLRKRLRDLEERDAAAEAQKLTETERLQKERDSLTAQLAERDTAIREIRLESAVTASAARIGFTDPAIALRLVRQDIEFGDDGMPKDVERALKDLASRVPGLVAPRTAGSFDTGQGSRSASPRSFTREQLRDSAFYRANEAAIRAAAREGRIRD